MPHELINSSVSEKGFPGALVVKNLPAKRDIMGYTGTETLWESHKDTHPERDTHTLRVIHAH